MARVYNFPLPYTVSKLAVKIGLTRLKREGIFDRLPDSIKVRLQAASDKWQSVTITKADCDCIPDAEWAAIASKLNLRWHKT